jgi:hypothetical protein
LWDEARDHVRKATGRSALDERKRPFAQSFLAVLTYVVILAASANFQRKNRYRMTLLRGDGFDNFRQMAVSAEKIEPHWHVGSDHWLDTALDRLWHQYSELRTEIEAAASEAERKAQADLGIWRERLSGLNPNAPKEKSRRKLG